MDPTLRDRLLALRRSDEETRSRLVAEGTLFQGYHEEMEQVHLENSAELEKLLEQHGWPGLSLVGEDGCEAAWLVAQHAISRPAFQRQCLELIRAAVAIGEAPAIHEVYLTDRIRYNQREPQVYGTIFDWDENAAMSPWPLESPGDVDEHRAGVGLPPFAEAIDRVRKEAESEGNRPPASYAERQAEIEAWSRKVGWID